MTEIKLPKLSVPKIIEYAVLLGMILNVWFWVNNTIATKTDINLVENTIELQFIETKMVYYERKGTNNLTEEEKGDYKDLEEEVDENKKARKRLLGTD